MAGRRRGPVQCHAQPGRFTHGPGLSGRHANHRVRVVDLERKKLSTLAGTGQAGFGGDGGRPQQHSSTAFTASRSPRGDRLYLADLENRRIRMIDLASGIVQTVAGNGQQGVPTDGAQATKLPLVDPRAVAADDKGNVYILERGGNTLRLVDSSGSIRTVAGSGKKGPSVERCRPWKPRSTGPSTCASIGEGT